MADRKRTTPPPCEGVRQGWESKLQTVQVYSQKDNSFPVNMQCAVRILSARYRLTMPIAQVVADHAGLGGGS
jgi:hypothetical protein